jgi:uncharacterized protein (TIGR03437 family)
MRWTATLTWLSLPVFLLQASAQTLGPCNVFPSDNIWNAAVDNLPLSASSAPYVNTIGAGLPLHPDFGAGLWAGAPIGIPFVLVSNQPPVSVTFQYADQSDPGPYPIPPNAPIEGGSASSGDRHVLVVNQDNCVLYELYAAYPQPGGGWTAGSGAIFDLQSDGLRPAGWTSADAAGLPILPGLVRYDEVAAGAIRHAIRFTAPQTQQAYVWPARHYASSLTGAQYPPMGQRFRLRADYDISGFSAANQVILAALKKYGMMLADNGSSWFLSGVPDDRWNNDDLHALTQLTGADFEAVDVSPLMANPDSGQVLGASAAPAINADGVVSASAFGEFPSVAPGSWIEIYGSNLAVDSRSWTASDFSGVNAPTSLDGTSVTIGGQAAFIDYISPGQVNALVPSNVPTGTQPMTITVAGATSTAYSVTVNPVQPGLDAPPSFNIGGTQYAVAVFADGAFVLPEGAIAGVNSRPAQPGDEIVLYGIGFGPVMPDIPAGQLAQQANTLASAFSMSIGSVPVTNMPYLGLAPGFTGLYQFNVVVPANTGSGAVPLTFTVDGVAGTQTLYLAVGN